MSETPVLDRLIKNVRVVRPHQSGVERLDLGIKDGKFTQISPEISFDQAKEVFDAQNLLGFPGVVDAHMHIGIYQSLDQDAIAESKAAAMGGVTTSLNYIRTGQYYLNKGGSYKQFFPEVLALSEGNFFVDYGYHVAPSIFAKCNGYLSSMESLHSKFLCSMAAMVFTVFPINRIYF